MGMLNRNVNKISGNVGLRTLYYTRLCEPTHTVRTSLLINYNLLCLTCSHVRRAPSFILLSVDKFHYALRQGTAPSRALKTKRQKISLGILYTSGRQNTVIIYYLKRMNRYSRQRLPPLGFR